MIEYAIDTIVGVWRLEKLTIATRPVVATAPAQRLDCLNAFLNIFVALQERRETEQRGKWVQLKLTDSG